MALSDWEAILFAFIVHWGDVLEFMSEYMTHLSLPMSAPRFVDSHILAI